MQSLLVTGTNTGVGKTGVAAAIIRTLVASGYRTGALKPACSGINDDGCWDDVVALQAAVERCPELVGPHCFAAPLAPPQAAALEGRTLSRAELAAAQQAWTPHCDRLVIEGVGGLLCPLTETEVVADLAADWQAACVCVVGLELGAINHALMTAEVLQSRSLDFRGWIFNDRTGDSEHASDLTIDAAHEIVRRSGVPPLAVRLHGSEVLQSASVWGWPTDRNTNSVDGLRTDSSGGTITTARTTNTESCTGRRTRNAPIEAVSADTILGWF